MTPKSEENKGDTGATGARGAKGDKGEKGDSGTPEPRRKLKSYEHSFEAVPAVVVADKTDKFGKRLGIFALILLILGFVIAGYIQSAKNGRDLKKPVKVPTPKVTVSVNSPASITSDIPRPTPSPSTLIIYTQGPAGRNGENGAPGRNGASPNQPNPSPKPTNSPSASPSPSNTPNPVASVVCTVINCPRSDNAKPRTHSK